MTRASASSRSTDPVVTPDEDAGLTARRWAAASAVLGFILIAYLDKAVLGLIAQPVIRQFHLTSAQFGFIGTAAGLLGPVVALAYAALSDRLPLKATLTVLAVLWSLTQIPMFFVASVGLLLVTRWCLGAAEGPAFPTAHTTMYSWFPNERRGLPAGLLTAGASLSKILFAPVLAIVVAVAGWQTAFLTVGVLGLLWAGGWALFGGIGPYRPSGTARPFTVARLQRLVRNPTIIGCTAAIFVSNLLITIVLTWLPSYFETALGFSQITSGFLFGTPTVAALVLLIGVGAVSDLALRRGARSAMVRGRITAILLFAGGLGLMTLSVLGGRPLLALVVFALGYGMVVTVQALATPAIAEVVPAEERAGTVAAVLGTGTIGGALSPWFAGAVLDAEPTPSAGYAVLFLIVGGIVVVGGAVVLATMNPERDAVAP